VQQSQNTGKEQISCFNHDMTFPVIKFFSNRKHFRQLHNTKINKKKSVLSCDIVVKDKAAGSHSLTAIEFENVPYFPI
jgi:hypothetical protein